MLFPRFDCATIDSVALFYYAGYVILCSILFAEHGTDRETIREEIIKITGSSGNKPPCRGLAPGSNDKALKDKENLLITAITRNPTHANDY